MRIALYKLFYLSLLLIFMSCGDDMKLFHERPDIPEPPEPPVIEPEYYWLLETIDYPAEIPGFLVRQSQAFTYSDDDMVKVISSQKQGDPEVKVDYETERVSYSRIRKSGSFTYYDSLLVVLNNQHYADYILHVTHRESVDKNGEVIKTKTVDDSTAFKYDAAGYRTELERYGTSGKNNTLSHREEYTYVDGNLVGVYSRGKNLSQNQYKYVYTYDDKEHAVPTGFCYEMPLNVSALGHSCWLFSNLSFMTDYLGKRSKNNIIRTEISRSVKEEAYAHYADINYEYTFDENGLVVGAKLSGVGLNNEEFKDLPISFSYLTKEKK